VAIYHFSAKVISRANGSSAVAAAAYRSASRLEDERLGRAHDFSNKAGVVHSEVLTPEGAPERWSDRKVLWNEVEAGEKRKDAQLAREVEFSIPREMSREQGVALARDFVQSEFVDRGMVADLNVHWDVGPDGLAKPHAHVMLSMREVTPGAEGEGFGAGFGKKIRAWNSTELLTQWRERWASHVNERLAELDIDVRIDHRTLEAQGIDLEPQNKIGAAGMRREERGEDAERAADHRQIARRNGERIIADPSVALDAITQQQSTFTEHDLARFVHSHSDDAQQFAEALRAVKASPELVALGVDGKGRERFSTRDMLAVEQRLELSAAILADRHGHGVSAAARRAGMAAAEGRGLRLGAEQGDALGHIVGSGDLAMVVGYAGTGKSAMLGVAREAWERAGYTVRGAALSGIAAESLEAGSGISSRTIASLEHGWAQERELLTSSDVLVIDEAGMIGSRQMDRVLLAAKTAGAKVVLVGDAEQLQAIEAGAAFRALTERHGAAEITEIRRQKEAWQREATRELATGRTSAALERYEAAGRVLGHETRAEAREALVAGWDEVRQSQPSASQLMLAHTRADVAELNQLARARMRQGGALGEDQILATERGERTFAPGDRLMFLRNERSLVVKNGSLGVVEAIQGSRLTVRLDGEDHRQIDFDLKDYAHIDHGYASTIHKSQGVTVDQAHLLATEGLDRHAAYVGLSRHRDALTLHYAAEDFKDRDHLVRTLSRDRPKDTTLAYSPGREPAPGDTEAVDKARAFAERRGLSPAVERVAPKPQRSMFDGLKLKSAERSVASVIPPAGAPAAVERYLRAWVEGWRIREQGLPLLEGHREALRSAGQALEAARPGALGDLKSALEHQPGLRRAMMEMTGPERTARVLAAIRLEAQVRASPELRAERMVATWRRLEDQYDRLGFGGDAVARGQVETRMQAFVAELKGDRALESLLKSRSKELGIAAGSRLAQMVTAPTVQKALSIGLGLGRGLSR
jgi:Ti-type conjugative transfer relaxase TraA